MPPLDLLQGTLDLLILKTLSAGPLHGYAVIRRIQEASGDTLEIKEGSLYPALHRLERRGWLRSSWGDSENGRRAKYYRLAPAARRHLAAEESAWKNFSDAVARVLRTAERGASS